MKSEKMKTKDIVTVVLLSLVNLVIFSLGSLFYLSPITIVLTPVVYSLLQGIVFFMLGVKVAKKGAVMLYCVLQGVVAFNIPYLICYVLGGIIAEIILSKIGYKNAKALTLSYIVIQLLASFGSTIYPYVITIESTLAGIKNEGNLALFIQKANEMIHSYGSVLLVIGVIVSAYIGALIGKLITKKHLLADGVQK